MYSENPSFRTAWLLIYFFSIPLSYLVTDLAFILWMVVCEWWFKKSLEQLYPLGIDCAGHSSTTCPRFEKSVLLINIFLKTNDILEHKIAYFLISIHSIFPLQIVCRCMQFMTIKWNHLCNLSGSNILDSAKPESRPTHLYLQNLCTLYHHTILNWSDVSIFIMFCEVGK